MVTVGSALGGIDGISDGPLDGAADGSTDGTSVGTVVSTAVRNEVGSELGTKLSEELKICVLLKDCYWEWYLPTHLGTSWDNDEGTTEDILEVLGASLGRTDSRSEGACKRRS